MTSMGPEPMPDQTMAAPQGPVPLSPMFIWSELKATQGDFTRRVDAIAIRLDRLDEHGSRGVDALRGDVTRLRSDIEEHERSHERQRQEQLTGRRWLIGVVVALLVPLYPALGALLYLVVRK